MDTFKGLLEFHDIGPGAWFLKQGEKLFLLDSSKIPDTMKSGDMISITGETEEVTSISMETSLLLKIEEILALVED